MNVSWLFIEFAQIFAGSRWRRMERFGGRFGHKKCRRNSQRSTPLMGIRHWKSGDRRDLDSDKSRNCRDFDSCLYNDCPEKNLITDGNQECGRRSAMAQADFVLHAKRSRDDTTEVDSQSKQSVTIQGEIGCGREVR
jgi:hypothetical protein